MWPLTYTIVMLVVFLAVWEVFAVRFGLGIPGADGTGSGGAIGTFGNGLVYVELTGNEDLNGALAALPETTIQRVLVLGSSQIATVKDGSQVESFPVMLQQVLEENGTKCDVVDFSSGGQQTIESMIVALGSADAVRPDLIVMGLGLFSMQTVIVRPALQVTFDPTILSEQIRTNLADDVSDEIREMLSLTVTAQKESQKTRAKTIQQRTDEWIGDSLAQRLRMIGNRREMFNQLVDTPVRRDLVTYIKRNLGGVTVARTYRAGAAFDPSVAALGVIGRFCSKRNIPVVVVVMPYGRNVKPIPYPDDIQQQVLAAIRAESSRADYTVVDLGGLLGDECFGLFVDGSPDGLHFKAAGHLATAKATARIVRSILTGRQPTTLKAEPRH